MSANVYDNRRENLRRLVEQWGGPSALGAKLGYSNASFIVQMAGPHPSREISERTARKIEASLDLPAAWLDAQPDKAKSPSVDTSAVAGIIRLVGQMVEETGLKLANAKFADLVALAYEDAQDHGSPRPDFIKRVVQLLK
jgi:hypothetical protein